MDTVPVYILAEGSGVGYESEGRGVVVAPELRTPERHGRLSTLVMREGAYGSTFMPLDRLTVQDPAAYRRAWGSPPPTLLDVPIGEG